ncbi:fumarylacetoacetase [Rhizorhapis suberifaciens]|uniref:fumarylacetoacetase n=1 Tax=Rhizorhapis suberifaciens TaxID=13656 RepID=A0A840HY60_9SPHN|nr:fumarylacetoacetase [Rhizorhapis suberifaciens]MBB4642490.1 fumarylacetoacetase [Rhizorhapis suberifaciens]
MIDYTHDPAARSWVETANGHSDFPIQNLPLGIFAPDGQDFRCGVAIGNHILDLRAAGAAKLLPKTVAEALGGTRLNTFVSLGRSAATELRHALFRLLSDSAPQQTKVEPLLHIAGACIMALPARPGGYTDFYAGIAHATNIGKLVRPESPLMPNYKYVPIGYHGRTSSIVPSGTSIRRPRGQIKDREAPEPVFLPSRRLDYEVELGFWVGPGNALGDTIPIEVADQHLAGMTLLNDWSARDIQTWEYQPLGPFLAKSFASTVSPWLVMMDALEPYRQAQPPRPTGDPSLLPYLVDAEDQAHGAFQIDIQAAARTAAMRQQNAEPVTLCRTSALHLYWTPAQLLAHHSSNGCPLEPGDLLGSGTISAPGQDGYGSLMELTKAGKEPFLLGSEERRFLEDGDEVLMTARCAKEGFATIGFGECRGIILPALNPA